MNDVNPNEIAAAVTVNLVKDFLKLTMTGIPKSFMDFITRYFKNFESSLTTHYSTCSTIRTIINKDSPVPLRDIYVKTQYKCNQGIVDDDALSQLVRDGKRIVVTGFGGIGKTVFCKYLWLSIFEHPKGKLPIFFELRNLNEISKQNLEIYLRISLTYHTSVIPEETFRDMMKDGRFIFILDGFDEVPDDSRAEIQRQILELAKIYPQCGFVVSSRSDDRFSSWQEFHNYHALPFTKLQARSVIQKIDFDRNLKSEFISEILDKRYDNYSEFFATPLLALMMLMTYRQIKYIPDSQNIFYRYAFQTLYTLHDASKQGFQRKRFLNLSENQFISVFSLFCLVSYIDMEHSFDKIKILDYFDKVKDRSKVSYDSGLFLKECVECVNLLFKEGERYSFTHRSFQEYFCAYAATHYFPKGTMELIQRIPVRQSDSVFSMMHEINSDLVEEMYIIPEYGLFGDKIKEICRETLPLEVLKATGFEAKLIFLKRKKKRSLVSLDYWYEVKLENYVKIIRAFFKNELPREFSDLNLSLDDINRFSEWAFAKFDSSIWSNLDARRYVTLDFRFRRDSAILMEIGTMDFDGGLGSDRKIAELSLTDAVASEAPSKFLNANSQRIKAEIVFTEKKCTKISRISRKIKGTGTDVLSL